MTDSTPKPSVIQIPLSLGKISVIDHCDAELASLKWHTTFTRGKYYAKRSVRRPEKMTSVFLHRTIVEKVIGRDLLAGEFVDHINGDSLDNRRSNLRVATNSENLQNRGLSAANTSSMKGVSWSKSKRKWEAKITSQNQSVYLGCFSNIDDAAKAYDAAAKELHGDFARLNFPEGK